MTEPLFIRQDEKIEVPCPTLSRVEASLNFNTYTHQVRHGLGWCDDERDAELTERVSEITIPIDPPYTISESGPAYSNKTPAELANAFISSNPNHAAALWLKQHADALNHAKKWYAIQDLKARIHEKENELRRARLKLNIDIVELNTGRNLSAAEKRVLLLEFGGTDEDF